MKFQKGNIPWNKELHYPLKNSGQFKKGHNPWWIRKNNPHPAVGHKITQEHRAILVEKMKGKNNPSFGGLSNKHKEKLRKSRFNYVKQIKNLKGPNMGKYEKEILDEFEKIIGFKIERQYTLCGYFIDGYIPELNIVFEVDERPKILKKDIRRENIIIKELKCLFIRIRTY